MTDNAIEGQPSSGSINKPLFLITGGFITVFCVTAIVNLQWLSGMVDAGFAWSAKWFCLYWQLLLLATFLIGIVLIFMPGGKAKMGGLSTPEFTVF